MTTISKAAASTGRRRMQEIAAANEALRSEIAARILSELGRPALAIDVIAAQNLAALAVKADQVERAGRNASAIRRQIVQAMRASFKPDRPVPPKPAAVDWETYLASAAAPGARL